MSDSRHIVTPELPATCGAAVLLHRIVRRFRTAACRHTFRLGDQSLTGIPEAEKPAPNAPYDEWMEYFCNRDKHPSHTRRVQWPCAKCGKVFFAHCGLDVLSHGEVLKSPNTPTEPTARK